MNCSTVTVRSSPPKNRNSSTRSIRRSSDGGDGVWGTDQYGIHTAGPSSSDTSLGVVCVYHPQITEDSVLRSRDGIDDETEARLNAALWTYSERVATLIEEEPDEFVRRTESEASIRLRLLRTCEDERLASRSRRRISMGRGPHQRCISPCIRFRTSSGDSYDSSST